MTRFQLAGAVVAGVLLIAANAAASYATMQSPATGGNAPDLYLIEDVAPTKEDKKLRPVQLICPASKSGTLTLISVSQYGSIEKYQVEYRQNKPVVMSLFASKKGAPLKKIVRARILDKEIKSLTKSESEESLLGSIFSEPGTDLLKNICNGSETVRKKYRATLEANQGILGLPAEDYPSNF